MTKFLSPEWNDAFCSALAASDEASGPLADVELTLQQVVTATPDGDVAFWTTFAKGNVAGSLGRAPAPDVTLEMDYATATALSRAELNHQAAFMQGQLKVTGNMGKLLQHQAALQVLGPVMALIDTEY
jgi:putative sterol carrier protein